MSLIPSTCRYNKPLQISVDNFIFARRDTQLKEDLGYLKIKSPSKKYWSVTMVTFQLLLALFVANRNMSLMVQNTLFIQKI